MDSYPYSFPLDIARGVGVFLAIIFINQIVAIIYVCLPTAQLHLRFCAIVDTVGGVENFAALTFFVFMLLMGTSFVISLLQYS